MKQTIGALLLYAIRGVLLWWLVWPGAIVIWIVRFPTLLSAKRRVRLRQIAGWFDLNLIAFLQTSLLRPFFDDRSQAVPWREARGLTHSPRFIDMA